MNRIFLKLLGLLFVSVTGGIDVFAQNALVLETNDGETFSYVLANKPQLTFNATEMLISSDDASASFTRTDIKNFRFEEVANAIKDVKADGQRMSYLHGVVTVDGTDKVILYDISGRQILSKRAADGESVTIDLNNQPSGTYIVRSGKQSLKVKN